MKRRTLARGTPALWPLVLLGWAGGVSGACSAAPEAASPPSAAAGSGIAGGGRATSDVSEKPPAAAARRSRRGIGCSVKNDCDRGLSCIRGVCQPSSFGLSPTAKECIQIDCAGSEDCCGGVPTEIPDKCRSRASTCLAQLPGCLQKACTRSSDCAGGGACVGNCAVSSGECRGNVDCLANKCVEGKCSLDFTACQSDAECTANVCAGGSCACENPNYLPTHPVCQDPDCAGLCIWSCEESRCVIPTSCGTNDDCFGAKPLCVEGTCVECSRSTDCSFGKICLAGNCETPCQNDAQCALFEACQAGECIYAGCRSDRECTLSPDVRALGLAPGVDPRLLRCHTENGVGRCVIPCQTDSQCTATEVCSGGLCKYIGCETTQECATILGVHEQVTSDEHPWIASVECRAEAE
jgi:hypothetical protein